MLKDDITAGMDELGVFSYWTPLDDRGWLFDEDLDRDDPWQFRNFRVA